MKLLHGVPDVRSIRVRHSPATVFFYLWHLQASAQNRHLYFLLSCCCDTHAVPSLFIGITGFTTKGRPFKRTLEELNSSLNMYWMPFDAGHPPMFRALSLNAYPRIPRSTLSLSVPKHRRLSPPHFECAILSTTEHARAYIECPCLMVLFTSLPCRTALCALCLDDIIVYTAYPTHPCRAVRALCGRANLAVPKVLRVSPCMVLRHGEGHHGCPHGWYCVVNW